MKLTDVIEPQVKFTKSGKNQIEGLPSQFTSEDQILNAILNLDLPLTDKIGLLGQYEMNKGRKRIEYDDQELFVGKGGSDSKKIGIRYGGDDDSLSGRVMYDPDTKNISLGISKKFAKGGRIGFKGGADMGTVADSQGNVGGQSVDISPTGDVRTSDKPPSAPDDRASDAQNFTNFLATQTNLKPKQIRRITGNQSFLERFGPNILRAALYGFNPTLGIGSLKARDVINLYDAFEAGKVISDEDLTLGKLGITSLAKGGRVNYQNGTNLKQRFDDVIGISNVLGMPGAQSSPIGPSSDFRHQAASKALADALSFTGLGGLGSFALGTVKEIGDFAKGALDPNMTIKDAFSQSLEDTISNFKGAFSPPGKTIEEIYEETIGQNPEILNNNLFNEAVFIQNLRADRARQIEEARKRALENIQNQRDSKPITTVTGTTKPGTAGTTGRDSKPTTTVTGTTKPGTSGGFQKQERQTAREDRRGGQYGFASGGLARMLGE